MSEFYWIPDGCIPDLPDFRDWIYQPPVDVILSNYVDLRPLTSIIEDQGSIGSCTANAVVGAIEMLINKNGKPYEDLSRLFIYYNTRSLDGSISNGDITYGSNIRSAIKTCVDIGVCTEVLWPYTSMLWNIMPNCASYEDAIRHRVSDYYRLISIEHIKHAVTEGYGIVFGIPVYNDFFDTTSNGVVPPNSGEPVSGHAMVIVGYNDDVQKYIVRNSWGVSWGDYGYCYIDYDYIHTYGFDFWVMKQYYGPKAEEEEPDPEEIPLIIDAQPKSGGYSSEQSLTFFYNKLGDIRVSINGGQYFTFTTPIPIVDSCEIAYYFKGADNKYSDKYYLSYSIDKVPMVVSPVTPPGEYRSVTLHFNSNISGKIYIVQPNDLLVEYDASNPIIINSTRDVTFYGVSSLGVVYPTKTIEYVINSSKEPIVEIVPAQGNYFKQQTISLSSFDDGKIFYYIDSDSQNPIEYISPFSITNSCVITYYHEHSSIYYTADYTISSSGMVYRINGGPWLEYIEPVLVDKFATVEAALLFEDGSLSDINSISYTVYKADQYWVVIG